MVVKDPTQRFSSRVANYVRYRPGYPPEVIDLMKKECGLTTDAVIADVAFGTGLFTQRRKAAKENRKVRQYCSDSGLG